MSENDWSRDSIFDWWEWVDSRRMVEIWRHNGTFLTHCNLCCPRAPGADVFCLNAPPDRPGHELLLWPLVGVAALAIRHPEHTGTAACLSSMGLDKRFCNEILAQDKGIEIFLRYFLCVCLFQDKFLFGRSNMIVRIFALQGFHYAVAGLPMTHGLRVFDALEPKFTPFKFVPCMEFTL